MARRATSPGQEDVSSRPRDALARIAVDLFARQGFAGTSIRDIARIAGCSVANVYHHFESKETLWLAIFDSSVRKLPGRLHEAMVGVTGARDRFERLLRAHIAFSDDFQLESQIFFVGEERLSPANSGANRAIQRAVFDIYLAAVRDLAEGGVAEPAMVRLTTLNVLGVVNWHLRWTRSGSTAAVRRIEADAVVGFVQRGIAAGRG